MKVDDTIRHDDCAQFSSSSPLRPSCTGVAACTAHIKCGCTECTPAPLQWRCAVRRQVENIHYSRLLSKGRTNPKVFGTVLPPSVLALVLALGRSSSTAVPPSNMSNQSISSSPISGKVEKQLKKKATKQDEAYQIFRKPYRLNQINLKLGSNTQLREPAHELEASETPNDPFSRSQSTPDPCNAPPEPLKPKEVAGEREC